MKINDTRKVMDTHIAVGDVIALKNNVKQLFIVISLPDEDMRSISVVDLSDFREVISYNSLKELNEDEDLVLVAKNSQLELTIK